MPLPAVRGLPPRKGDLRADPPTPPLHRHPRIGGQLPLRGVQVAGQHHLRALRRTLHHLQRPQQIDPGRVVGQVLMHTGKPPGERDHIVQSGIRRIATEFTDLFVHTPTVRPTTDTSVPDPSACGRDR